MALKDQAKLASDKELSKQSLYQDTEESNNTTMGKLWVGQSSRSTSTHARLEGIIYKGKSMCPENYLNYAPPGLWGTSEGCWLEINTSPFDTVEYHSCCHEKNGLLCEKKARWEDQLVINAWPNIIFGKAGCICSICEAVCYEKLILI